MINFQIKPKNQNFIAQKRLKDEIQQNPEIKNGKKREGRSHEADQKP